ncbi:hypothetical protein RG836_08655 [Pseudomonas sp. SZMC_28357]|nr:hypothetical protein [Pseudomonas sp. SZMC_28357]MDR9751517.1 hypothetical protein [Pseudomonas sp. SZMC_28357]
MTETNFGCGMALCGAVPEVAGAAPLERKMIPRSLIEIDCCFAKIK